MNNEHTSKNHDNQFKCLVVNLETVLTNKMPNTPSKTETSFVRSITYRKENKTNGLSTANRGLTVYHTIVYSTLKKTFPCS